MLFSDHLEVWNPATLSPPLTRGAFYVKAKVWLKENSQLLEDVI